jgi:hypothetical protein
VFPPELYAVTELVVLTGAGGNGTGSIGCGAGGNGIGRVDCGAGGSRIRALGRPIQVIRCLLRPIFLCHSCLSWLDKHIQAGLGWW